MRQINLRRGRFSEEEEEEGGGEYIQTVYRRHFGILEADSSHRSFDPDVFVPIGLYRCEGNGAVARYMYIKISRSG